MDFDLLSFPPEILAKIFSNIPWDQLINVKLTAKDFNNIINNYLKDMQKPKLCEIEFDDIKTRWDDNDKITVTYKIFITGSNGFEDTFGSKKFCLLPSELDQLHSFLKKVDLTSLRHVEFMLDSQTEVMRIFSNYFQNTNRIETICVTATHFDKEVGNPLSFLGKIQNVGELELHLNFPH
uniref:F-box domain-containing protein n=1 Tax=Strongyloides venezuelensis TaxID=75913 RepID=A0A0K0G202_STRVS